MQARMHVSARYWSLMIEALSEQSALNIYCSIFENSPQVCTLAISSFLLYLGTAFFLSCRSQLSRAFIVSQTTFAWLQMWLC